MPNARHWLGSWERIWEAWHAIVTPGLLIELITSMPERIEAVIAADARFTRL
jgi:hypothetical protein